MFYIYIYLDPRKPGKFTYGQYQFDNEPFYVGKGFGDRFEWHLKHNNKSYNVNKFKTNKILKIKRETNQNPIIIKYRDNILSELQAFDLEKDMIATIGRADLKLGPLTNLTDGGEGCLNRKVSQDTIEKIRKSNTGRSCYEETKKLLHELYQDKSYEEIHGIEKAKEIKEKLSQTIREKYKNGYINPANGYKHTENWKINQSKMMGNLVRTKEWNKHISEGKRGKTFISKEQREQISKTLMMERISIKTICKKCKKEFEQKIIKYSKSKSSTVKKLCLNCCAIFRSKKNVREIK